MSFAIDFGTSKGLGLRDSDIPASSNVQLLVAEYAAIVLFNPALMATKTSILLLYRGIARNRLKFLRIASYVTLAVVNIGGTVLTFVTAFQCRPVQAAYNLAIEKPNCISIETIYLSSVPVNVATDLAIFVLPIPVLTSLRLPMRQKIILLLTFLLGIFVTIVDVVRIYYMQLAATSLDKLTTVNLTTSLDFSYYVSLALLWSTIEVNVGIICACIPTLRPLAKLLISKMGSEGTQSTSDPQAPELDLEPSPSQPNPDPGPNTATGRLAGSQEQQTRIPQHFGHFGLLNIEQPKCMLDMRGSESAKYYTIAASFPLLVGFAYSMLLSINSEIPVVTNETQAIAISSATYGGSVVGPFLGLWVLSHLGFKTTFITALGISSVGTLMFWPSGALRSYHGFIVSNFVVGFALSILDQTSNAFFALCGPPQYAEFRLLLGQSVQGVVATLTFLLCQRVFFVDVIDKSSLLVIQWTYLGIALIVVLLGLFLYYIPLPEATDSDLQSQAERRGIDSSQKYFGRFPVIFTTLAMAVLSMFFAGGASVCVGTFIADLISDITKDARITLHLATSNYNIVQSALSAVSQFVFAFLCLLVPPRLLLLLAYVGAITCSSLILRLELHYVIGVEALGLVLAIFEGPIRSLTFAIGLRSLGRWTKLASCLLESGMRLGACAFPFVMLAVLRAPSHSDQYSFRVALALFAAGAVYPLYLNLFHAARFMVAPKSEGRLQMSSTHTTLSRWFSHHFGNPVSTPSPQSWNSQTVEPGLPVVERREEQTYE
jgi:fucose permease